MKSANISDNFNKSAYEGASTRRELLNNPINNNEIKYMNKRIDNDEIFLELNNVSKQISKQIDQPNYTFHQFNVELQVVQNNLIQVEKPKILNNNSPCNPKSPIIQSFNKTWKKSALIILLHVRKFISIIKTMGSSKQKFKQLNQQIFSIIDDKASSFQFYKKQNYFTNEKPSLYERLFYLCQIQCWIKFKQTIFFSIFQLAIWKKLVQKVNFSVIDPNSSKKIFWDAIVLSVLIINMLYLPFSFAFIDSKDSNNLIMSQNVVLLFKSIPGITIIVDMLISFNTAFFNKGELEKNRKKIVRHYLHTQFIMDIITSTFFILSFYLDYLLISATLLLRFQRIVKIIVSFEELLNLKDTNQGILNLVKLGLLVLYSSHFCGCTFYVIGKLQEDQGNWINKNNIAETWHSQYINSLYWAVITMLTVGYGDITPSSELEKLYVLFVAFFGCGLFAYTLNSIGLIAQEMTKKTTDFKNKMAILSSHLKKRGLNFDLQTKVNKYFQYLFQEKQEDNEEAEKMLKQLTSSLKKEVLTDIYLKILRSSKVFYLNFSDQFLQELAPFLKEQRIQPEEYIFRENTQIDKLYFLMSGKVQQFSTKGLKIKIFKVFEKGEIFDINSFFTGCVTNSSIKTINIASLVYINKSDFLELLRNFPDDHEKYCMIKDNILVYNKTTGTGICCTVCQKYNHQMNNCPYIIYSPNKDKILMMNSYSQEQIRTVQKRNQLRTQTPLSYLEYLKLRLTDYYYKNMPDKLESFLNLLKYENNEDNDVNGEQILLLDDLKNNQAINHNENMITNMRRRSSLIYGNQQTRLENLKAIQQALISKKEHQQQISNIQNNNNETLINNQNIFQGDQQNTFNKQFENIIVKQNTIQNENQDSNSSNISNSQLDVSLTSPATAKQNPRLNIQSFSYKENNKDIQQDFNLNQLNNLTQQQFNQLQPQQEDKNKLMTKQTVIKNIDKEWGDIDKWMNYKLYFPKGNLQFILIKVNKKQQSESSHFKKKKDRITSLYQNAIHLQRKQTNQIIYSQHSSCFEENQNQEIKIPKKSKFQLQCNNNVASTANEF